MTVSRRSDGTIEEVTWHDRRARGKPRVVVRFALVDGRIECVRLEVGARFDAPDEPDPRPLTTADLRAVDLGRLVARAKTQRAKALERIARERSLPKETREAARHALLPARASRIAYDPREVAAIYQTAWDRGERSPTKAVAEHFSISTSAAGKRVWKARHEFGLLPKTRRGKARGGGRKR